MIIPVRELIRQKKDMQVQQVLELPELAEHPEVLNHDKVEANLRVFPDTVSVHVTGELHVNVQCACSRCLKQTIHALTIPFEETFSTEEPEDTEEDDLEEGDVIHYITEDKVDLTPYILENAWLGVPFVPLCKDDCKGLCPECGIDKNEQSCECKLERIDPRLAGLQAFFDED